MADNNIIDLVLIDFNKSSSITKEEFSDMLRSAHIENMLYNDVWQGEITQPLEIKTTRWCIIEPIWISHKIIRHWWNENILMATVEFMANDNAQFLKQSILDGKAHLIPRIIILGNKDKRLITFDGALI